MENKPLPDYAVFEDYRYSQRIAVVIRWFLLVTWLVLLNYRTDWSPTTLVYLNVMGLTLAGLNGYVHWRAWRGLSITRPYVLALSAVDLTIITAAIGITSRFDNTFYVFYYPALLGLSLVYPSRGINFTAVTLVAIAYITLSVALPPGVSYTIREEKALAVRVVTMFAVVVAAQLVHRVERTRRQAAVAAERQQAQENLELQKRAQQAELAAVEERSRIAREIHDGIAQSIYMLNISLEACAELASRGQNGLQERLQSLVQVSKQALLETRHYIFDLKPMLDGARSVTEMVEHQVQEFRTVTSIPTSLTISGTEIPLSMNINAGLYRVVQEGLANVFKHAQASQVEVQLTFGDHQVRLQIKDNGKGFDPAHRHSGYGLQNMEQRAKEMGGDLTVDSNHGQGTCLTLVIPAVASETAPTQRSL